MNQPHYDHRRPYDPGYAPASPFWMWFLAGLVALALLIGGGVWALAGMGGGADDGLDIRGLDYSVVGASTQTEFRDEFTQSRAQGTFVVVRLRASNPSDVDRIVGVNSYQVVSGAGEAVGASRDAIGVVPGQLVLTQTIPARSSKEYAVVFDVPGAVQGSRLRIEDFESDEAETVPLPL